MSDAVDYVTDTHALYWYLTGSARLGAQARAVFVASEQGEGLIYIPSIVLAEIYYVNAKYGCPLEFSKEYERLASAGQFSFVDFRAADILHFDALADIPEMHDRMIAGVAYALGLPLLTRAAAIIASQVIRTVW